MVSAKQLFEIVGGLLIVLGVVTVAGYQVFQISNVPNVGWII